MNRIDSSKNQRIKNWKKLQMKKERDKTGLFLIEGFHLVEEALKRGVIEALLVTEDVTIPTSWNVDNLSLFLVTEEIIQTLSETKTPQGIVAVCRMEQAEDIPKEGMFLFIDAVQDPGNLGTMIRTADAAGATAVIVGEGSADIYNSKTIRATQGSLFHLPIVKGNLMEWVEKIDVVYGTALENAVLFTEVEAPEHFALVVGNEGQGVNPELLAQTDVNLYVPIYGQAESLNVSVVAGILLYGLR